MRSLPFVLATLAAAVLRAGVSVDVAAQGVEKRTRLLVGEVAVTFDDLPVATRVFHDVAAQERITSALLAAVRRHDVPAIGFVNEGKLSPGESIDERRVALLGVHGFSRRAGGRVISATRSCTRGATSTRGARSNGSSRRAVIASCR